MSISKINSKSPSSKVRSLEYDKREKDFEAEVLLDSTINDMDEEMVELYRKRIGTDLTNVEVLKARGFIREKNNTFYFTKAGMLLFGKSPTIYLPSARVRVLNELGIVRELNEGVKRIYSEMERFYLKAPVYSEPDKNSVLLVLENNVVMRSKRKTKSMLKSDNIGHNWEDLSYVERQVLQAIYDKGEVTSDDVSKIINRGKNTAIKLLNRLQEKKLIEWTGTSKYDNNGRYIIK